MVGDGTRRYPPYSRRVLSEVSSYDVSRIGHRNLDVYCLYLLRIFLSLLQNTLAHVFSCSLMLSALCHSLVVEVVLVSKDFEVM